MPFRITRPFDTHVHLRRGNILNAVAPLFAKYCAGIIVMPNTVPEIETGDDIYAYRDEINFAVDPPYPYCHLLMMLMLTQDTTLETIERAKRFGAFGIKIYPYGSTTNSDKGIRNLRYVDHLIEYAAKLGLSIHYHGEEAVDGNREVAFLPHFQKVVERFPTAKHVLEHLSTWQAVEMMKQMPANVGCTVTPHHLLEADVDPSDPFLFCHPVVRGLRDRNALQDLVLSGHPNVMFGSDFAPHTIETKLAGKPGGIACPPAIYLPLLFDLFEQASAAHRFEDFISGNAIAFHRLRQPPMGNLWIKKQEWTVPEEHTGIRLYRGGTTLPYKVVTE